MFISVIYGNFASKKERYGLANDYSIGNCVACRGLRGDEDSAHRKALRQPLLQLRMLPAEQAREVA